MRVLPVSLMLCAMLSGLLGQDGKGHGGSSGPAELAQLRKAWLMERRDAGSKVDDDYLESLETMKARMQRFGNATGVAAVEKEILARLAVTATREGRLPDTRFAKGSARDKVELSEAERVRLEDRLDGAIWRVDQAGEGLRWYYFEAGGKAARKSRLTDWLWTELDGEWKVDGHGVVTVVWPHATVQIFQSAKGEPQISMNQEGTLSVRPFRQTDLKYPGAGKE